MAGSLGVEISTWPGACDMGGGTDDGPEIDDELYGGNLLARC